MIRLSTLLATVALAGTAFAAQPHPAARAEAVAAIVAPLPQQQSAPTPVRKPFLRPELTLASELVSFGDLLSGLPSEAAATPGFRAPALGETGTIQVSRIMEAARAAGIIRDAGDIESHGFAQVIVTRAARRLMASDPRGGGKDRPPGAFRGRRPSAGACNRRRRAGDRDRARIDRRRDGARPRL